MKTTNELRLTKNSILGLPVFFKIFKFVNDRVKILIKSHDTFY